MAKRQRSYRGQLIWAFIFATIAVLSLTETWQLPTTDWLTNIIIGLVALVGVALVLSALPKREKS